ncbi:venom allergen 3 homolog isoform X3 [Anabrus simplex]|uniref:venom allergen 3 homolog isoform X3 n=1 Tax=Anabrus simplex TaxID=316456 RepID=UPI0035A35CE1
MLVKLSICTLTVFSVILAFSKNEYCGILCNNVNHTMCTYHIWDDDVAEVAQRWADQCRKGHDQCRNDRRFGVGQSVFWTRKTRCHEAEWEHAIRSWYREVRNLPLSTLRSYKKTDVGHYTQLVWANTEVIGCGYRTRNRPRGCETFYVCNYGRGGNMKTQKVYQIGPPRFACRNSPVDPKYPALC